MACLDNLISLRELCTVPVPTSGYYLNDIGITKSYIEQVITKDFASVQAFVDQKSSFAAAKVQAEIYSHTSPKFKANSILSGGIIGHPAKEKTLTAQSGYVGVHLEVHNPNSFLDFTISDFSVFTDFTGDIDVLVYDLDQGLLLGTITVPSVAGQISRVYEKLTIPSLRTSLNLWIGFDSTGISSYLTQTHSGCRDCFGTRFSYRFVRGDGAGIDTPFINSELTALSHTGGLSFNYSVSCNHLDWMCNHRPILAMPILYKTGMEIAMHAKLTAPNQRTMAMTSVNSDLIEEQLARFEKEYAMLMFNILNNMKVPEDQNCFECNSRIVSRTTLP